MEDDDDDEDDNQRADQDNIDDGAGEHRRQVSRAV